MKKSIRGKWGKICYQFLLLLVCCPMVYAQKKVKKYKDGYIIRFSDTVSCKIYTGHQENEIGYEVKFKYADGRVITYHPGSVVKGFGYIGDDGFKHFYAINVPEYWINEQQNNKAYAEVLSSGQLQFFKYTEIKNSIVVVPTIIVPGVAVGTGTKNKYTFFIKSADSDSLIKIGRNNLVGPPHFTREEIIPFIKNYVQAIAEVGNRYIYQNELAQIITRYNLWYERKKQLPLETN
jgi:hypothetical protein